MAQLSFALAPANSGIPMTSSNQSALKTAMQGGAGTQQFVQNQIVPQNFFKWLQEQGDTAWIPTTSEGTDYPAYFAAQKSGNNSIYFELTASIDSSVTGGGNVADDDSGSSSGTGFTWNNQTYNVIGTITGTFSYNDAPLWQTQLPVGIVTGIPAAYLAKIVWANALKPLMQGCFAGLKSCFAKCKSCLSDDDVADAADDAADDAAVDGAQVGEDTLSMGAVGGAFLGMAVFAAIPIVIQVLAHDTFHTVQVYNLLPNYDLQWSLAYQDSGAMNVEPVTGSGSTTPYTTIPAMANQAPPGLNPVYAATDATFGYANTNQLEGFGYVLEFQLTAPGTTTPVSDTAYVLFFVPLEGSNAVAVNVGSLSNVGQWYNSQNYNTANQTTQASASDTNVVVTATFDYLTGQHPGPSGEDGYFYNSVVVFAPPPSS